jgi:hypothetical protein
MRVLSPRMLPPVTLLLGSMASTATRLPCRVSSVPSASMNVLLPTPGTPVMPTRRAPRERQQRGQHLPARATCSGLVALHQRDGRASTARSPAEAARVLRGSASTRGRATAAQSPPRGVELEQLEGALGDDGARPEDGRRARRVERGVVLRRDHAAHHHHDVGPRPSAASASLERRHQREVTGGQRADAHHVHVVLDRLLGHLGGRLEQRAHVHVEAQVGERGGDDLLAAVVPVLAHLGHQDARPPALAPRRTLAVRGAPPRRPCAPRPPRCCTRRDATGWPRVRPKTFSSASLISPTVALAPRRLDGQRQQVALAGSPARPRERLERSRPAPVALGPQRSSRAICCRAHLGVVDLEHVERRPRRPPGTCSRRRPVWRPESMRAWVRAAPPRCAAWAGPPRWPWPCRPAPRPPGCAPRPSAASAWVSFST